NTTQEDTDMDGVGDACTGTDTDMDGWIDTFDNCVTVSNGDQLDVDGDGIGDVCDNCPTVANQAQLDADMNGVGDLCEGFDSPAPTGRQDFWDRCAPDCDPNTTTCYAASNCATQCNDMVDNDNDGLIDQQD